MMLDDERLYCRRRRHGPRWPSRLFRERILEGRNIIDFYHRELGPKAPDTLVVVCDDFDDG